MNLIDPRTAKFEISSDIKGTIQSTFKQLAEYVTINNDYVNVKTLEERNKAKR